MQASGKAASPSSANRRTVALSVGSVGLRASKMRGLPRRRATAGTEGAVPSAALFQNPSSRGLPVTVTAAGAVPCSMNQSREACDHAATIGATTGSRPFLPGEPVLQDHRRNTHLPGNLRHYPSESMLVARDRDADWSRSLKEPAHRGGLDAQPRKRSGEQRPQGERDRVV